jgi:hypothetical protein
MKKVRCITSEDPRLYNRLFEVQARWPHGLDFMRFQLVCLDDPSIRGWWHYVSDFEDYNKLRIKDSRGEGNV